MKKEPPVFTFTVIILIIQSIEFLHLIFVVLGFPFVNSCCWFTHQILINKTIRTTFFKNSKFSIYCQSFKRARMGCESEHIAPNLCKGMKRTTTQVYFVKRVFKKSKNVKNTKPIWKITYQGKNWNRDDDNVEGQIRNYAHVCSNRSKTDNARANRHILINCKKACF